MRHRRFCVYRLGGVRSGCVPLGVCTARGGSVRRVYRLECVPLGVCTARGVYRSECVPLRGVYRSGCVPLGVGPFGVCTARGVYRSGGVPLGVCTARGVYRSECVPLGGCTARSVKRSGCVALGVCTARGVTTRGVYRWGFTARGVYHSGCVPSGCVPLGVCTARRVYRLECVPLGVCTARSVYRSECVPLGGCTARSVKRSGCVPLGVCTARGVTTRGVYRRGVYHSGCVPLGVCTAWGEYSIHVTWMPSVDVVLGAAAGPVSVGRLAVLDHRLDGHHAARLGRPAAAALPLHLARLRVQRVRVVVGRVVPHRLRRLAAPSPAGEDGGGSVSRLLPSMLLLHVSVHQQLRRHRHRLHRPHAKPPAAAAAVAAGAPPARVVLRVAALHVHAVPVAAGAVRHARLHAAPRAAHRAAARVVAPVERRVALREAERVVRHRVLGRHHPLAAVGARRLRRAQHRVVRQLVVAVDLGDEARHVPAATAARRLSAERPRRRPRAGDQLTTTDTAGKIEPNLSGFKGI